MFFNQWIESVGVWSRKDLAWHMANRKKIPSFLFEMARQRKATMKTKPSLLMQTTRKCESELIKYKVEEGST